MKEQYERDAAGYEAERRVRIRGVEIRLALALALAILSSFIPFMNIFLTPFFIIAGLVLAWRFYTTSVVDASEASTEV